MSKSILLFLLIFPAAWALAQPAGGRYRVYTSREYQVREKQIREQQARARAHDGGDTAAADAPVVHVTHPDGSRAPLDRVRVAAVLDEAEQAVQRFTGEQPGRSREGAGEVQPAVLPGFTSRASEKGAAGVHPVTNKYGAYQPVTGQVLMAQRHPVRFT